MKQIIFNQETGEFEDLSGNTVFVKSVSGPLLILINDRGDIEKAIKYKRSEVKSDQIEAFALSPKGLINVDDTAVRGLEFFKFIS